MPARSDALSPSAQSSAITARAGGGTSTIAAPSTTTTSSQPPPCRAVTAARNHHPPIEHSFAYRFDSVDRSIVISGDTTYSESVLQLARRADVLVHEALFRPFWERPDAPRTAAIRRHILASHTDVEDVGRLAAAAGVRTLVLTHFVPSDPPGAVSDGEWMESVRRHFKGEVVLGRDLLEV